MEEKKEINGYEKANEELKDFEKYKELVALMKNIAESAVNGLAEPKESLDYFIEKVDKIYPNVRKQFGMDYFTSKFDTYLLIWNLKMLGEIARMVSKDKKGGEED